ncbi:MAG: serine/threonine-protein kinase [Gemmatimonadaceae bacterium]|nr:serine/threonine-protein kinase [Gemmatimonadaceae bacterium]
MSLPNALRTALADRYELLRELGQGGMATVYLARDVRHAREVAIKVLHPELAAVLGAERFLSEIRTTASLQHPHILPLFDSGEAAGQLFYVMPFVDGETLRSRLEREKQLPIADAVLLAREVADALQYAHDRGVIHRDIKPENILLQGGHALVADFGIALAVTNAGGARMTQTGLSLGTPQYMAPEQAMGERTIDARADVYALGAVTYEMLAGEPPFTGPTSQAIVAKVMSTEPQRLDVLRRNVPATVADAVHLALEKLPADRPASARAFGEGLTAVGGAPRIVRTNDTPARTTRLARRTIVIVALTAAAITGAITWPLARRGTGSPDAAGDLGVIRADVSAPPGMMLEARTRREVAISNDGQLVATVASDSAGTAIVLRRISQSAGRLVRVPSVEGMAFSPDGAWLGYVTRQGAFKVRVDEGAPVSLAALPPGSPRGLAWTDRDTLVTMLSGLEERGHRTVLIPANGGTLLSLDNPGMRWPVAMAGGVVLGGLGTVKALRLADRRVIDLGVAGTMPLGVVDGHLLYATADAILTVPFDPVRLVVTGAPVQVIDSIESAQTGGAYAALSPSGTLITRRGLERREVVAVRRDGSVSLVTADEPRLIEMNLAPDGRRLLLHGTGPLRLLDLETRITTLLNRGDVQDPAIRSFYTAAPAWAPDGRTLYYTESQGRVLRRLHTERGGTPDSLPLPAGHFISALSVSPDGRFLLVGTSATGPTGIDAYVAPIDSVANARPIAATTAHERMPVLSADGRWVAYVSDEQGENRVYLRPFPGPGAPIAVSDVWSSEPRWDRRRPVLYVRERTRLVEVVIGADGRPRPPQVVVSGEYRIQPAGTSPFWDISPDGNTFYLVRAVGSRAVPVIAYHWAREFTARQQREAGRLPLP